MHIHYLQHVTFEDLAAIKTWVKSKKIQLSRTRLFAGESFPELNDIDGLVIVGGPMGVYDEDKYPWLSDEKKYIETAIKKGKKVLGICLGAQLIASVLGAKVYKNQHKEIGWFEVTLTKAGQKLKTFKSFPINFTAFHWHGDTFEIPSGAEHIAFSAACINQAFDFNQGQVLGLQFHLESTPKSISGLLQNCRAELVKARYIQPSEEILQNVNNLGINNQLLNNLLTQQFPDV